MSQQWRSESALSEIDRWIVRMGIGYFSAAEGIVGDNVIHVVRELVTASELKLVLGRHAHEENIHADSLLYMISSLGIDPHECEAMFDDIPTIVAKNEFVTRVSHELRRGLDMTLAENKQLLARNAFVFGQCMEGTQFYGLFGMILSLYRQGKLPGVGMMFRYTLRDESNHIELFRRLLLELVDENPQIWTPAFREELRRLMAEAVELEKRFIRDCLPVSAVGLSAEEFEGYIDHIADRRLEGIGLEPLTGGTENPLPWLAELMDIRQRAELLRGPGDRVPEGLVTRPGRRRRALVKGREMIIDFDEILDDLEVKRASLIARHELPTLDFEAAIAQLDLDGFRLGVVDELGEERPFDARQPCSWVGDALATLAAARDQALDKPAGERLVHDVALAVRGALAPPRRHVDHGRRSLDDRRGGADRARRVRCREGARHAPRPHRGRGWRRLPSPG